MLSRRQYQVDRFGVRRSNEGFWSVYNTINPAHFAVQSGTLNLTRDALSRNRRGPRTSPRSDTRTSRALLFINGSTEPQWSRGCSGWGECSWITARPAPRHKLRSNGCGSLRKSYNAASLPGGWPARRPAVVWLRGYRYRYRASGNQVSAYPCSAPPRGKYQRPVNQPTIILTVRRAGVRPDHRVRWPPIHLPHHHDTNGLGTFLISLLRPFVSAGFTAPAERRPADCPDRRSVPRSRSCP
jgi:hypothetical protein